VILIFLAFLVASTLAGNLKSKNSDKAKSLIKQFGSKAEDLIHKFGMKALTKISDILKGGEEYGDNRRRELGNALTDKIKELANKGGEATDEIKRLAKKMGYKAEEIIAEVGYKGLIGFLSLVAKFAPLDGSKGVLGNALTDKIKELADKGVEATEEIKELAKKMGYNAGEMIAKIGFMGAVSFLIIASKLSPLNRSKSYHFLGNELEDKAKAYVQKYGQKAKDLIAAIGIVAFLSVIKLVETGKATLGNKLTDKIKMLVNKFGPKAEALIKKYGPLAIAKITKMLKGEKKDETL